MLALGLDLDRVGELLDHVADARHRGVDDERAAAAGAQRPDAEVERAGLEVSATSTVSSATCAGARAATTSATSTASSSRSSGRSARAANIPTTRRSTGPTSGPAAIETRVGASELGHAKPIAWLLAR